jgi:hypothetical protein
LIVGTHDAQKELDVMETPPKIHPEIDPEIDPVKIDFLPDPGLQLREGLRAQ